MIRRVAVAACLAAAACVTFEGPPGPPDGSYAERLETFARLLRMEDARDYDPLLAGRSSASPDAWIRAKTALAAGRLKDPEAVPHIPVLLDDRDVAVRRAAAFAGGLCGDRRVVRFLTAALEDGDAGVRENAAEALGKLGGADAIAALRDVVGKPGPARIPAARALWRFSEPWAAAALTPPASDGDVSLARAAVYALARKPLPESAPVLREALSRPDPETAAIAARALGLLADASAEALLVTAARRPETSVAVQSLLALEKLGAKTALGRAARDLALARAAERHPGVAVAAMRLLSRFPDDAEVAASLEKRSREAGWRGQTALVSLARAAPARALPLVGSALGGPSLELRLAAAESVSVLPASDAAAVAARALEDRAARVRALVVASLPKDLAAAHGEILDRALRDPDAAVRGEALSAAAPLAGGPLRSAWDAAFREALRDEPSFAADALDAATLLPDGGRALVEPHVDAKEDLVREKARRLMVEKFGVDRSRFRARPVKTRYTLEDYRRIARTAIEETATARVTVRGRGTFTLALALEEAPLTVTSFRELCDRGFFGGIVIHRVVPDFVVQAGDPRGDGNGGPGYAIRDEINPLRYARGAVGMALSGPDTGGSQWFVTLSPQPHLDGGYTVFGAVTSGMEVLDAVEQDDVLEEARVSVAPRAGERR